MEYTKGEWKVGEILMLQPDFSVGFSITDDTNLPIAVVAHRKNARLIAKAPKLYEACKAARDYYRNKIVMQYIEDETIPYFKEYPQLVKALTEAEGK